MLGEDGAAGETLEPVRREVYRRPFEPLLPDVTFLSFNELAALEQIDAFIAAVIIEPVQGEGGVRVPDEVTAYFPPPPKKVRIR